MFLFRKGWMPLFMTLGKLIISIDITVKELTQLLGLQYSSYVCDIIWVLWCISFGEFQHGQTLHFLALVFS